MLNKHESTSKLYKKFYRMPTYLDYSINELRQGDILKYTEEIKSLIPSAEKLGNINCFLVLTQCCDLAKRNNNQSKTDYIHLAVVKPISFWIHEYIKKQNATNDITTKYKLLTNKISQKIDTQLHDIIKHQNTELYFLEKKSQILQTDSVAYLRWVYVLPLNPESHEILLKSKKAELYEVYRDKLAWQVSNLYSRIGLAEIAKDDVKRSITKFKQLFRKDFKYIQIEKEIESNLLQFLENNPQTELADIPRIQQDCKTKLDEQKIKKEDAIYQELLKITKQNTSIENTDKFLNHLKNNPTIKSLIQRK